MKKYFSKKNILTFLLSAAIFYVITRFSNVYLSVFDVSSVRVSGALNPVLGMLFGLPAILGCAVANFISDLVTGWGIVTALLGFPAQLLYGLIPFFLWRRFIRSNCHISRLDDLEKVSVYLIVTIVSTAFMGLAVGAIQYTVAKVDFWSSAYFAAVNDFTACIFVGMPLMSLHDLIYSKGIHKGKRKLSFNEIVILTIGIVELVAFIVIAVTVNITEAGLSTYGLWSEIFLISSVALAVGALLAIFTMTVHGLLRGLRAGLRIIEKPNGTVFVDEKKRLEFVSFPGQSAKYRVKSDTLGYTLDDARKDVATSYEDAWYCDLSCQKGCEMKCLFCDCPGYGYYGNVSADELRYQIRTILDNTGSAGTKYFCVDFMRMGEPTLNPELLGFIEYDLRSEVLSRIDADVIEPRLSTILPKNKPGVADFLIDYCRIKNDVYGGNADLQFSICSTDENERQRITKNMALTLEEISEIGKMLPPPKGSKYRLCFPMTAQTVIDTAVIDRLFDKDKFSIKLTPIHDTFNASDNGFRITSEYTSYDVYEPVEKAFRDIGWDVFVYLDKKCEDDDSLTCGNLLISNIRDKLPGISAKKKRVGIVVAIEIGAIFDMYKNCKELESPPGMKLFLVERDKYSIYVVRSGMGECAASAACQFLISKCNVTKIINFGVVGGLTADMSKLTVCLVDKVVHYKYDCSELMPLAVGQVDGYDSVYMKTDETLVKYAKSLDDGLNLVTCCSGDKFIGTAEEKSHLHETFGGDICDMESAGIVLTCNANKVPCILFKAVSDGLSDGAEGFFAELDNASKKCLRIADKILDNIASIES